MKKYQTRQSEDLVEHIELLPSQRRSRTTTKTKKATNSLVEFPESSSVEVFLEIPNSNILSNSSPPPNNSQPNFSIYINPLFVTTPIQTSITQNPPVFAMAVPRAHAFIPFNGGKPLNLSLHDPIPGATLKSLPSLISENHVTPIEHIRDVESLCVVHHITEENVALRLLETSLVEEMNTIKRAPQEKMTDFNYHFERTWNRIPTMVKPSPEHAFLYYLKDLNSDISIMIQSMGGVTLPTPYDISIRAEKNLIQAGKIAPRPPMSIFPDTVIDAFTSTSYRCNTCCSTTRFSKLCSKQCCRRLVKTTTDVTRDVYKEC